MAKVRVSRADAAVKDAKDRFDACWSAFSENRTRMLEDLRFSNPADPQQWDRMAVRDRGERPMLVFDQSNQYIAQVVNDARQNKPAMRVRPVDDRADVKTAKALNGLLYHIQDASRADIAYDTAIESAARVGLGWLRVLPEVVNAETNEQEIRIKRVHQFDSIVIDDASTEPDGSDAMDGFAITSMSATAFRREYSGATTLSWDEGGWFSDDFVRIAEHFKVVEKLESYLAITLNDGAEMTVTEKEYWELSKAIGYQPRYRSQWTETVRSVKWTKMSGAEVLEESDFPASYIPLIPVIGNELWIDGKRYLCGMVRKGMDAQKAYNYARSTEIELTALQPKSPLVIAAGAVEGFEDEWAAANTSRQAYLRWNHIDGDDKPLPKPERMQQPQFPAAFAQQAVTAREDLQAAFGMYKSNLGAPSNAISGRAKMQDQREGDTANFHYVDNLRRSIDQMGRICIEMIPRIYDTKRVARILGEDGTPTQIIIDPESPQSYVKDPSGKVTINPSVGTYDVKATTGPAYATLRQEAAEQMTELFRANPQTFPLLGALWMKHQDWPFAEEASQILKALQPPQVQAIGQSENPDQLALQQQVQTLTQQLQQLGAAAQQMDAKLKEKAHNEAQELAIKAYEAETARMQILAPAIAPEQVQAIVMQTLQTMLQQPTPSQPGALGPMPPGGPPIEPPMGMQRQQTQPPPGGFSLPAQGAQGPIQ